MTVLVTGGAGYDPAVLVASCEQARQVLGWTTRRSDIATIVRDAWRWERR